MPKTPSPVDSHVEHWLTQQQQPLDRPSISGPNADPALTPHLSVVIPAYNEQWRLPTTLIDVIDYFDSRCEPYEVVVVDDGSSDETALVVEKFRRIRSQVKVISLPRNRGKGCAVRTGVLASHGQQIVFADADGSTPIREIERLRAALETGAEVAIGSRAIDSSLTQVKTHWYRKYPGRFFNFCVNSIILPGFADTQCGFKLFTRRAARFLFTHQKADGFSFDVEILYIARRTAIAIMEVPVNWVNVPGSKVNMLIDALKMLRDLVIFRLRHRNLSPELYQEQR